ncbi:hypothetical protein L5D93_06300 [Paenibacillus thiaminolyticus]|nr:hypothetical protein [Paenibacillus thiaminolyticus]
MVPGGNGTAADGWLPDNGTNPYILRINLQKGDQMIMKGIIIEILGAGLLALGLLAIKKPDAWTFKGILDEPSDEDELLIIQIRGVVLIIAGTVIMVFGLQNFLV